ncbi:MAG: hypothetical protein QM753_10860 [Thermomicrobiales bacterium]
MFTRVLSRIAVAGMLSLTMLGGLPALAQHDPRPPAFPAATSTPAATAATASSAETRSLGEVRSFTVEGQPMAISPDGKWLAGPGADRDFCIWDVTTLDPRCATDRKPMSVQLETITWAPDSSAVAFSLDAARLFIDSDIYVMDIDGALHDLTDDGDDDKLDFGSTGKEIPVDMYPAWSPDSSQLAFARTVWGGDARPTIIYTIDRDGGEPVERFVVSPQEPFIIYSPLHWLGDGSIVFSVLHADPGNTQNGVWRLTASGGVKRVIAGDASAEIPTPFVNDVSPDGTVATVFSMSRWAQYATDGEPVYFLVNLESGEITPLEIDRQNPVDRVASVGTFLPGSDVSVALELNGNIRTAVLFDRTGALMSSVELPEDAVGPASNRGFSVADDGTVFMSTVATEDRSKRGGIIFTIAEP